MRQHGNVIAVALMLMVLVAAAVGMGYSIPHLKSCQDARQFPNSPYSAHTPSCPLPVDCAGSQCEPPPHRNNRSCVCMIRCSRV